jgi:hypothetical protein
LESSSAISLLWPHLYKLEGEDFGQNILDESEVLLGTPLENTLGTYWEPIENLKGTCWEQRKNEKIK